jgi:hypothetical protein
MFGWLRAVNANLLSSPPDEYCTALSAKGSLCWT